MTRVRHARAVVLAIGYYDLPNYLGIPGEDLPHVSHYYTDAHPYYRQRVVVVGGKNSAAEAALELFRGGAHVTLVHRHAALGDSIKYWVRPDIDNRIKEGSIQARFETTVCEIRPTEVVVQRAGSQEAIPADGVFLLTGYHPDAALMTAAGVDVRSGDPGAGDSIRRRSRRTCRTCFWPADAWPARPPATSSSRTAVFTARRSSPSSPRGSTICRADDPSPMRFRANDGVSNSPGVWYRVTGAC